MSFLELARKRCSIRKYAPKNVEQEKIDYILEAARLAPSAVNYQPWYFVWVQSAEGKAKLQECYPREWFKQAPYYLIVCGDHQQSWKRGDHKSYGYRCGYRHGTYLFSRSRTRIGNLLGLQFRHGALPETF